MEQRLLKMAHHPRRQFNPPWLHLRLLPRPQQEQVLVQPQQVSLEKENFHPVKKIRDLDLRSNPHPTKPLLPLFLEGPYLPLQQQLPPQLSSLGLTHFPIQQPTHFTHLLHIQQSLMLLHFIRQEQLRPLHLGLYHLPHPHLSLMPLITEATLCIHQYILLNIVHIMLHQRCLTNRRQVLPHSPYQRHLKWRFPQPHLQP